MPIAQIIRIAKIANPIVWETKLVAKPSGFSVGESVGSALGS